MTTVIAAILGLIAGAGIYQWGHKEGVKSQHWKIADLEERNKYLENRILTETIWDNNEKENAYYKLKSKRKKK